MEVQQKQPVDPVQFLLESFNGLREDVDNKLDGLTKQVHEISIYVAERRVLEKAVDLSADLKALTAEIRAQDKRFVPLERLLDLPAKLEAINARIEKEASRTQALETARETDKATNTGKKSIFDKTAGLTAYIALLLGIVTTLITIYQGWKK
jgi:hypothetical protein